MLPLYWHCIAAVLQLYCHCVVTVLPLCCHCVATIATVLAMYCHCCHCTGTVLPLLLPTGMQKQCAQSVVTTAIRPYGAIMKDYCSNCLRNIICYAKKLLESLLRCDRTHRQGECLLYSILQVICIQPCQPVTPGRPCRGGPVFALYILGNKRQKLAPNIIKGKNWPPLLLGE